MRLAYNLAGAHLPPRGLIADIRYFVRTLALRGRGLQSGVIAMGVFLALLAVMGLCASVGYPVAKRPILLNIYIISMLLLVCARSPSPAPGSFHVRVSLHPL